MNIMSLFVKDYSAQIDLNADGKVTSEEAFKALQESGMQIWAIASDGINGVSEVKKVLRHCVVIMSCLNTIRANLKQETKPATPAKKKPATTAK